jgi:hypothetical protein
MATTQATTGPGERPDALKAKRRWGRLTDAESLLRRALAQRRMLSQAKRALEATRVVAAFAPVVGPMLAKQAVATRLENGILTIAVRSSALQQELHLQGALIAKRLREKTGVGVVQLRAQVVPKLPAPVADPLARPVGPSPYAAWKARARESFGRFAK